MFQREDMAVVRNWLAQQVTPQRIEVIAQQCGFTLAYAVELITLLHLRGDIQQVGDGYSVTTQ